MSKMSEKRLDYLQAWAEEFASFASLKAIQELIVEVRRCWEERDKMTLSLTTLIDQEEITGVSIAEQLKAALERRRAI